MVEESPKIKELPQTKIEESLETHVVEETSNVEPCYVMNEKNIEKEEYTEIKEKERVEEKERLIGELYFFDSMSTLFEESKKDKYKKETEIDFEKRYPCSLTSMLGRNQTMKFEEQ
ncbi:hypothetical protein M9H77_19033 [Catharanthus roseus]|uniref:Uncharacterized protein n=1 Tax=Catharanthus roseus TaxID=4058 RepID=A0ACC0B954_CATRO|nr:hypothetical protein M9H77_19033 [Catharanthus roseus]